MKNFDYVCYFDGSCGPNNPGGNMGTGAIVIETKTGNGVYRNAQFFDAHDFEYKMTSNNVAEYLALIDVLNYIVDNNLRHKNILIRGDSNLVIMQMSKRWKAKQGRYKPYYEKAMSLASRIVTVRYEWIPREQNVYADDLSKLLTQ